MKIYVGVGHGRNPDGVFDPGAVAGNLQEHPLPHLVVEQYALALQRAGWDVIVEPDSGKSHDPTYAESAMRANRADVDFADEVHFNKSSGVGHGTEVWIHPNTSAGNRKFAELASRFVSGALGIRDRGIKEDRGLVFLKSTHMPSTIPEIAFIDNAGDAAALARPGWAKEVGEALARARIETSG